MRNKTFTHLPKPYGAYAKAVYSLVVKPKGKRLPDIEYIAPQLITDAAHLTRYNQVCGFVDDGTLPPTYLAVRSQALQMQMMTQEAFPFALMGLVHIRNSITQYRRINASEPLHMSVRCVNLRPHDKGNQFDFVTTVSAYGDVVWRGITTYLARGKPIGDVVPSLESEKPVFEPSDEQATWSVQDNIGRRYAAVSGDYNPIHIHRFTAKLLGFPRAIAHGMWSKAHCLAQMGALPDAFTIDVAFKLPILLPAQLSFQAHAAIQDTRAFALTDAASGKPHLAGTLSTLANNPDNTAP